MTYLQKMNARRNQVTMSMINKRREQKAAYMRKLLEQRIVELMQKHNCNRATALGIIKYQDRK